MKLGRIQLFRRDMGQDIRAWPMLALLLLVIVVAIGCVLWFMREAMRNERLAVRQKVVEAYRAQLTFLQKHVGEQWQREMERLEREQAGPALFARAVQDQWADSVICLDESGSVLYPQITAGVRDAEANAELLAVEKLSTAADPQFDIASERLRNRLMDYSSSQIPAPQRRFLMRALQKLRASEEFPTLPAEDLAAKYLEANGLAAVSAMLSETPVTGVWACASTSRRVVALFKTATLRAKLEGAAADYGALAGMRLSAISPDGEGFADTAVATGSLAPLAPGWRLALVPEGAVFDTAAEGRVAAYVWIGSSVIAGMTLLILLIALSISRQVNLARMKNDLVATVSHELKTPLTAMRALVDTLLENSTIDEKTRREYLELLSTENARLSRLIENFLTFSRLERNRMNFNFVEVHPGQLVDSAVAAMGERCRSPECLFESHIQAELPLAIHTRAHRFALCCADSSAAK